MKYFAACHLPGNALQLHDVIYHPANWRHIHCTDEAPEVVCAQLMGKSRLDYLVLPSPHFLSGFMSRGIQFDSREALCLTWRETFPLRIGGKQVDAHMIWMKSVNHPDFPESDPAPAENGEPPAPDGDPADDARSAPPPPPPEPVDDP